MASKYKGASKLECLKRKITQGHEAQLRAQIYKKRAENEAAKYPNSEQSASSLRALKRKAVQEINFHSESHKKRVTDNDNVQDLISEDKELSSEKRISEQLAHSPLPSKEQGAKRQRASKKNPSEKLSSKKLPSNKDAKARSQYKTKATLTGTPSPGGELEVGTEYSRQLIQEAEEAKVAGDIDVLRLKCLALLGAEYIPTPKLIDTIHTLSAIVPKDESVRYLKDAINILEVEANKATNAKTARLLGKLLVETDEMMQELDPKEEFVDDEEYETANEGYEDDGDDWNNEDSDYRDEEELDLEVHEVDI